MNLQYFPMDRQLCHIEIESCKCLCVSTLYDAYFIILYFVNDRSLSYDNDGEKNLSVNFYFFFYFLLISVSFYPADSTEPRARGEKDQAHCTYNLKHIIQKMNYAT
uniref:Neurotransmitter-gated ion-channel ligand-binding domain-containing protein n=1 Tax=Schizaphis graminum TaxID=13262 RepID=A0A2S2PEU1_SCHGA